MKFNYNNIEIELTQPDFDSRKVVKGSLFVAIKGVSSDGHDYINKAIEMGASTIVCETMPENRDPDTKYIVVEDSAVALAQIASKFYGEPSSQLKLVGVTGTNGKTTTATLLYDMFRLAGYKVGLISTVIYKIDDKEYPSTHTTPDSLTLNKMLSEMVDYGCEYCFMEVSSHAICQKRISGLNFTGAIFTNITHDHLDYHGNFMEYIKAKKLFFDSLAPSAFAIYNGDDKNGSIMVQNCAARKLNYALATRADYKTKIVESHMGSMLLEICSTQVWVRLIGRFNGYNLTAVYATAIELGLDKESVLKILSTLGSVAGRFDYIQSKNGITAIVDYAHTPDALENVLNTINEVKSPSQRVITVVGCGGNRDKTKRPEMAKAAVELSDFTILTSDNPRFEEPAAIIDDMRQGVKDSYYTGKYISITDRAEAIAAAAAMANGVDQTSLSRGVQGDIILIAGKGHEPYQEVKGVRSHFDDKEQISSILL